jgi:multiple sugar transport system substrate-binding protein
LTIMSPAGEISPAQIKAFEALYPEVKVKQIVTDPTRLNAMLAAGSPPDIVRDAGTDVTPYIVTKGIATDLTPYFAKSSVLIESDIMPINDAWKYDGSTQGQGPRYGLAKDWSQDAMWWYNTAAFKAANQTVPSMDTPVTYDELLSMAKELTKSSGGKTSVYGLFTQLPRFDIIAAMVATAGGRLFSADLATADFSSPEAQKALTWFIDAAKAKVGYSPVDPSPDWDGPEYIAGHQVDVQQGYWFGGYLATTGPKLSPVTQFAAAPLLGSTRISPSFGAVGYWIPKKSSNADAAWAWMEWYCGGAGAKTRLSTGGGLPSLKSLFGVLPKATATQQSALAVQNNELQYLKTLPLASPYALGSALDATLAKVFPAGVSSGTSAAKMGDQMTSAVNAVLASGKKLAGK